MSEKIQKVGKLIVKYWRQELEDNELNFLIDWANASPANRDTFNKLTDPTYMVKNMWQLASMKQLIRDKVFSDLEVNRLSGTS